MRIKSHIDNKTNPETTAGGRALKFYSSVRLDVRRAETVKESGEAVSNKVKIKVVKNKVAPPFKETTVTIKFGKGLDLESEIFDICVETGDIVKSGSWFSLKSGERIGQGADNAKKFINEHPDIKQALTDRAKAFIVGRADDCVPSDDDLAMQNATELDSDIIDE